MTKPRSPFGPRASADWFRIEAKAETDTAPASADVYIYEQIGYDWWTGEGVTAKSFAQQLAALDVDTIRLHINSPGGLVHDGLTIMNAIRDHKAHVEVTVDGLAASAASFIAMAGDVVTMNRGAQLMIHDASTVTWGNAAEIEKTVVALDKISDSIADVYQARAGNTREHWRDLMKAETWYTAEEAVTAGLADAWVDAPEADAAEAVARFDLSAFAYAGRAHAPAPRLEIPEPPASTEPGPTNRKENVVAYDDLKAGIAKRLGVTDAAATDETLLAALDQALDEQADDTTTTAALPEGVTVIDSAVLADLQAKAEQGAEARAEQAKERREGILNTALNEGRIAPASRDQWAELLEENEESTAKLLASFPKNKTVPVAEIGRQPVEESGDDALYAQAFGDEKEVA